MAPPSKLTIYCGSPAENTSERRMLSQLAREFRRLDIEAVILANFYVGAAATQIDLVAATNAGTCVVEVKGYRHPVEG
jgi:hypothetical protein